MGKRLWLAGIMIVAIVIGFAGGALAQTGAGQEITQPERPAVRTIFSYRQEIGLTEEQEQKMVDTLLNLQKTLIEKQAQLGVARLELRQMIDARAPLAEIRQKLQQISALSVEITYQDLAAGREIEAVMSAEQLKRWRAIQAASRQQQ
jgi:hypothetical protein